MPKLTKKALSLYLRNRCERQLRLTLHSDRELRESGMPPRQTSRPGLGFAAQAGDEYQLDKVNELRAAFGDHVRAGKPVKRDAFKLESIDLLDALQDPRDYELIVEADFDIPPTFEAMHGLGALTDDAGRKVVTGRVRPDLLQVLPAVTTERLTFSQGLEPTGEVVTLPPGDLRQRLRVVDIKLSSQPGANYFGEVAFYSMVLAAWLEQHRLEDRFVVVPAPAIWPGTYEDSTLKATLDAAREGGTPAPVQVLLDALEADFEVVEYEVFAPAVTRFLRRDLPRILRTPWEDLSWHANFRCLGCDFFGHAWTDRDKQPTLDPRHCAPTAERTGHLSRVVGLTRGLASSLRNEGVTTVRTLAGLPSTSPVFDTNHALRMKRTLLPARAKALTRGEAFLAAETGASAVLPTYVDLRVFIDLEYDPTTAITGAIGLRATWARPVPFGVQLPESERERRAWGYKLDDRLVYVVTHKDRSLECTQFIAFLQRLKAILDEVRVDDEHRIATKPHGVKEKRSTYQVFLWDGAQLKHLSRLVSRHLQTILATPGLDDLAWLFPSPELLKRAEDATRATPVTLVSPAVESYLALPLAHHYTLLDVVQHYRGSVLTPSYYVLGQHFHDPLSNLVPPERIHEMWQASRDPEKYAAKYGHVPDRLEKVAHRKTVALTDVTNRLTQDLRSRGLLAGGAAPAVGAEYERLDGVTDGSQLMYQYHRLNAATQRLESEMTYALPVHERVAKFKAARLGPPVIGSTTEKQRVIKLVNAACQTTLDFREPGLLVFPLPPDSRSVNFRPGDIGLHLSPAGDPVFLHRLVASLPGIDTAIKAKWVTAWQRFRTVADSGLFEATVLAIDRVNGYLVLRPQARDFERLALGVGFDYRRGAMLDRIQQDFLTSKLKVTLRAIGAPVVVPPAPQAMAAIATGARGAAPAAALTALPATEFLWDAGHMQAAVRSRAAAGLRARLEAQGTALNESQWQAFESALTRRLTVMWGPPGTGKSQTIRTIIRGAVLEAEAAGRPLRLLVTANTYTAVDNVLLKTVKELHDMGSDAHVYRVQSSKRPVEDNVEALSRTHPTSFTNVVLNRSESPAASDTAALLADLDEPRRIVVIGAPAQQLHNLAYAGGRDTGEPRFASRPWFDLTIIDEASQLDVATSTLVFTKSAPGSACLLAGDDLQLPPIHPVDKPEGLEAQVGSLYEYMVRAQGVPPVNLDVNYRSNEPIVAATRLAGYVKLDSYSRDMSLNLLDWPPPATTPPPGWPAHLHWTPAWLTLLEPQQPVTCFVYDDETSGQANDFEADAIAALLWLTRRHLANGPVGKLKPNGSAIPTSAERGDDAYFWGKGVGIVTPHKAQVGRVTDGLQRVFSDVSANSIRAAVDTVERFQGQERQLIIASFGVGDPDVISSEDAFLYDIRRFNVMVSRAETKLIVFLTRSFLNHLSNDKDVLDQSSLVKRFADAFCRASGPLVLGHLNGGKLQVVAGELRHA